MAEELVMWVDEEENIIKAIPLSLANSDPKYLHLEIAVFVTDNIGRVLLQKRSSKKKVAPGVWTVAAAGHVTYGETIEKTAYRELKEEMGIAKINLKYLFREAVKLERERHFCHWFIGVATSSKVTIQESEVDDYAWVTKKDYSNFCKGKEISQRTDKMLKFYWAGEWDSLLV